MTDFGLEIVGDGEEDVIRFLDSFHRYAATARFDEYFDLFHPEGKFLGTDANENWTMQEFKDWSRQFFENTDCAWEYIPVPGRRIITIQKCPTGSSHGPPTYAIFDEVLYSTDLKCHTRGSGTLIYENMKWLLMTYHILFPIPDSKNAFVTSSIIQDKKQQYRNALMRAQLEVKEAEASVAAEKLLRELDLESDGYSKSQQETKKNASKLKNKGKKKKK